VKGTLRVRRLRRLLVPGLIALALILSACTRSGTGSRSPSGPAGAQGAPAPVGELTSIDTLRGAFNDDAGSTRLILLISPT
jgi:hypothetical protein